MDRQGCCTGSENAHASSNRYSFECVYSNLGEKCNYIYDKGQFLEIHKMDTYPSSWFVNDQIIQGLDLVTG